MKKYNPNKFLLRIPAKPTQQSKNRLMEIMTPTEKLDEATRSRMEQLDLINSKLRKHKIKTYSNY